MLLLLATLFANLGMWQTRRAAEKTVLEQQFLGAPALPLKIAIARGERFAHIDVSGRYDPERHILLDNQVWNGRAGVHVFTPFRTGDGSTILVNRGWLPLGADRNTLPGIPTPQHQMVLRGILNKTPTPGRALGEADKLVRDRWPQLVTYLQITDISKALQIPLMEQIVQLSAAEQTGFEGRDWKPVFLGSDRHRAYAFQWFALMVACLALWVFISYRKPVGSTR